MCYYFALVQIPILFFSFFVDNLKVNLQIVCQIAIYYKYVLTYGLFDMNGCLLDQYPYAWHWWGMYLSLGSEYQQTRSSPKYCQKHHCSDSLEVSIPAHPPGAEVAAGHPTGPKAKPSTIRLQQLNSRHIHTLMTRNETNIEFR